MKEFCSKDKLAYQVKDMSEDKYFLDFSKVDGNSKLGKAVNSPVKMGSLGEQYKLMIQYLSFSNSITKTPSELYDSMIYYYDVSPIEVWEN